MEAVHRERTATCSSPPLHKWLMVYRLTILSTSATHRQDSARSLQWDYLWLQKLKVESNDFSEGSGFLSLNMYVNLSGTIDTASTLSSGVRLLVS